MSYLLTTGAAVAAAFNLVCSGTIESTTLEGTRTEPYSYIYRLDLDAKKWCDDGCGVLRDIAEVQPAFIVLQPNKNIDTSTQKEFYETRIERETGRETTLLTSGRRASILIMKWEGQCEKQPFTGFPKFDTKF